MGQAIPTVYGKRACSCQIASLPMIEARLRAAGVIKQGLDGMITQQAYSSGVSASGGTHDGGGVWDVEAILVNTAAKRRIWRECGVAMWHRTTAEGDWPEHGHGVWIGCPHLQGAAGTDGKTWVHGALKQVDYYRRGLNGLASKRADQGPSVPLITWQAAKAAYDTTNQGGLTMADIDRIMNDKTGLGYVIKQLKAIGDGANSRARMNRDDAAVKAIVQAGVNELARQIATKPDLDAIEQALDAALADLDREDAR